jgi:diketogulonate reductase-like aldo/keto reductase
VIPGSASPEHIRDNAAAADLPRLTAERHADVREVYDKFVRGHVHQQW